MRLPDVKDHVQNTGGVLAGDSAAAFEAFIVKERQRLGDVVTTTGIVLTD